MVVALSILALTVTLSIGRPRLRHISINPAAAAAIGALLTLLFVIPVPLGWLAIRTLSRPVVTVVSLMIVTLVAERAGLFRVLAWRIARAARGDGRRLFAYLFLAASLTGMLFTNDAAILIFTPLVCDLVDRVGGSWRRANRLPYYFAVLFVANSVGVLVISNPINIIVASLFDIGFMEYARWMVLPGLVSILTSYAGLAWIFRHQIPKAYAEPPSDRSHGSVGPCAAVCASILMAALIGFFSEQATGVPVWAVAAAAAVLLLAIQAVVEPPGVPIILKRVGWDVVLFVIGMFIVAYGLRHVGLAGQIAELLRAAAGASVPGLTLCTALAAAGFSAIMNNHPTATIMAMVIEDFGAPWSETRMLVFAALIGGDLGPRMLPIGSLAALLWFAILRSRGVSIPYGLYVRTGVPITIAAILLSILTLNLEFWYTGAGPD
ncbi:MAG TPA: ArsB/NhaD family transporter [Vicinamibacterales bacterium]|nr:ArsB/NhaD family transporter [Vicinamibacterales bacterium]